MLRDKTLETEKAMGGGQVSWASTPKDAPIVRRKGILFCGVLGNLRLYAFTHEEDREQFVYDRNDTLFALSRTVRAELGLSPPVGGGTKVGPWSSMWAAPKRARAAQAEPVKAPPAQAGPAAPAAVAVQAPAAAPPEPKRNRFRK